MDPTQPFYYHVADTLQSLSLRVTLRRIHGGLEESKKSGGKARKDKKSKASSPAEVEKTVSWQEKVFGPREIAVLSPGSSDRKDLKSPRTPRSKGSSASSIGDSDYRETLYQRLRDG